MIEAGGTVNASGLAKQVGIAKTDAGDRLVSLQKNGFLLRVERPPPAGDLFIDPRTLVRGETKPGTGLESGALTPNRATVAAIEAARRGEVVELGSPTDALAELNRDH
ncbi:MAG: hypothetical protein OXN89_04865 [Bryobacterales bacterium]|nr:hypothetical protein [Bryobacterales bacterium]